MPHTDIRATVPEDVDIFEEIGRATGEEQLAAIPISPTAGRQAEARPEPGPVTEAPIEPAVTEARVPGAAPVPAAPVTARDDMEDVRSQIRGLLGSERITDLIEAQRMLGQLVQEETETAAQQAGISKAAVRRPTAPQQPLQIQRLPQPVEPVTEAQQTPAPKAEVTPSSVQSQTAAPPAPPGQPPANVLADLTKLLREAQSGSASVAPQTTSLGGRPTLGG